MEFGHCYKSADKNHKFNKGISPGDLAFAGTASSLQEEIAEQRNIIPRMDFSVAVGAIRMNGFPRGLASWKPPDQNIDKTP